MSTLSQFLRANVKSIQTGTVHASCSSGSGQDAKYFDITVTSVTTAKSVVLINGTAGYLAGVYFGAPLSARLTSATNLRVFTGCTLCPGGYTINFVTGQWTIVEFY